MPNFICETRKGKRHAENQDRALARASSDSCPASLIAVADGISGCPFGASVARWLVDEHLTQDAIPSSPDIDAKAQFQDYLMSLNEQFRSEFSDLDEMLESGSCLSIAFHLDSETHCFWVGDSPIYETRLADGHSETELISRPDSAGEHRVTDWFGGTSPFQLKHRLLSRDATICTITSDGAIVDAASLNKLYQEHGLQQEIASRICEESLMNPEADDVSIVAMKLDG